jgi:hypothetical protein
LATLRQASTVRDRKARISAGKGFWWLVPLEAAQERCLVYPLGDSGSRNIDSRGYQFRIGLAEICKAVDPGVLEASCINRSDSLDDREILIERFIVHRRMRSHSKRRRFRFAREGKRDETVPHDPDDGAEPGEDS